MRPLAIAVLLLLSAGIGIAGEREIIGPAPVFQRPDLSDPPALLPAGHRLAVLEEGAVFLQGPPGAGPHPVRRRATVWRLASPDGGPLYGSPDFLLEPNPVPGGPPYLLDLRVQARLSLCLAGGGLLLIALALALALRRRWGFLLLALSLASAGAALLRGGLSGDFATWDGDESVYLGWAHDMASGRALHPSGHSVGWSLLLAPLARFSGLPGNAILASWRIGPWLGPLLSAGMAVLTALLAARLWGSRGRGLLAGFSWVLWNLLSLHPHTGWPPGEHLGRTLFGWPIPVSAGDLDVYYFAVRSGWSLLTDAPAALLLTLAVWLGLEASRKGGPALPLASGFAAGFAVAVRSASLLALPVWGATAAGLLRSAGTDPPPLGLRLRALGWAIAGAALGYAPQAWCMGLWTGNPLASPYSLNTLYTGFAGGLWSLSRALREGLPFYAGYFGPLALLGAAGLFRSSLGPRGPERNAAWVLPCGALVLAGAVSAFAYGTNQPGRFVLPMLPWLLAGLAGGRHPWFLAAALFLVPAFPLPVHEPLRLAGPVVLILVLLALRFTGRCTWGEWGAGSALVPVVAYSGFVPVLPWLALGGVAVAAASASARSLARPASIRRGSGGPS